METVSAPTSAPAPTPTMSPKRKAGMLALIGDIFGTRVNSPERCRKNIRQLYPIFTEDISVLLETLLKILKKYEFSLYAHENLLTLCQNFNSVNNEFTNDPLTISLNKLSNSENHTFNEFKVYLNEWIYNSIDSNDSLNIQNNQEEFRFLL
jgi:hypothetical protein